MNNKLKKIIQLLIVLTIFFSVISIQSQIKASTQKNVQDVEALNKIISIQKKRGADISENLNNKKQYKWNKKTGRLIKLVWNRKNIKGKVDVSSFKALQAICMDGNKITDIKLGNLKELKTLQIRNNKLKKIDTTHLTNLKDLWCDKNRIKRLDLKNNTKLKILACKHNRIKKLNVKKLKRLIMLTCGYNQLKTLDVSANELEWGLGCENNKLTKIKLKHNANLDSIDCQNNQLKELNLDDILSIQTITCYNNKIRKLDLTTTDQMWLYEITCDIGVELIGREEKNRIGRKRIKNNIAYYEIFPDW